MIDCGLFPHDLTTGDSVVVAGHTGSTPSINGTRTVTVVDDVTFTIPVTVTVAGTGGTVTEVGGRRYHIIKPITLPTWLKRDEQKRHIYCFNLECFRDCE